MVRKRKKKDSAKASPAKDIREKAHKRLDYLTRKFKPPKIRKK